ncbi:hypothetical protein CYMTET_24620, partial [Cymbomonas tetramitiformis]
IGFFDENMQKSLSQLIFNLFLPAIIFNNVLKTAMSGAIATLWILPLFAILQVGVGYLLGFMARALSGYKGVEGKTIVASVAHCNGSNLALVFVDAVARTHPALIAAAGGAAEAASTATAYLSLYIMGWQPMLYLVGFNYIKPKCDPAAEECEVPESKSLIQVIARRDPPQTRESHRFL